MCTFESSSWPSFVRLRRTNRQGVGILWRLASLPSNENSFLREIFDGRKVVDASVGNCRHVGLVLEDDTLQGLGVVLKNLLPQIQHGFGIVCFISIG